MSDQSWAEYIQKLTDVGNLSRLSELNSTLAEQYLDDVVDELVTVVQELDNAITALKEI
jgi:hypothetical protein